MATRAKATRRVLLIGLYPSTDFGLAPLALAASLNAHARVSAAAEITPLSYRNAGAGQILADIIRIRPSIIGLSCYLWNRETLLEVAAAAKRALPACRVIVGGPEFLSPQITLRQLWPQHTSVDLAVLGEGEETLAELVDHLLAGGTRFEEIRGLAFPGAGGSITVTGERPPVADLGRLASPYRYLRSLDLSLTDFDGYESSRGCARRCSYCAWSCVRGRRRCLPVDRVRQDLADLAGLRAINFLDSAINGDMKRFRELVTVLKEVQESRPEVTYSFFLEISQEKHNDEICRCLKGLNIGTLWFGIQTISDRALAVARRSWWRPQVFAAFIQQLRCTLPHIRIGFDLIYGLPGDDLASHRQAAAFAMSLMPDVLQSKTLSVVPGSEFFEQPERYGIRFEPHPPYALIESPSFSPRDLAKAEHLSRQLGLFSSVAPLRRLVYSLADATGRSPFAVFEELGSQGRA